MSKALALSILGMAAALLVQVVPLPITMASVLSPHAAVVRASLTLGHAATAAWTPLTIDVRQSAWAAAVTFGAFGLFGGALTLIPRAGLRHIVRGITAVGCGCAALAIAQAATAGRSIYWTFPTEYEGPLPFGPFVNRNHFATWMLMAVPLCVGYIAARTGRYDGAPAAIQHPRAHLAQFADGRMVWLTIAGAVMMASLLLSASRSGLFALTAAGIVMGAVTAPRASQARRRRVFALLVLMVALGLWKADLPGLADRVGQADRGVRGRLRIWSDTLPVVGDFWLTGTGAGTYRTAMLVYQRADRDDVQFNQAHSHYLQVATEGGLLLGIPVLLGVAALGQLVATRLLADRSGIFWIRAGAACGLLAVALQSVWETGLAMPANAALAAVVAAIALHDHATEDASS